MAQFRLLAAASLIAVPLFTSQVLAADPAPAAPRTEKRIVIIEEKTAENGAAPSAPGGEVRRQRRVVIGGPDGAPALAEQGCKDGQPAAEAQGNGEVEGQRQVVRLRICGSGDKAAALDGVKRARARVAADAQLSASVKQQVLQQLDAEIERLSKQG